MPPTTLKSEALLAEGISHGFFTRQDGVSPAPYDSLNCGYGSGDTKENVTANRALVLEALEAEGASLITPYQHHSADVLMVDEAWAPDEAPKGDAIVTDKKGLAIGILTADCMPVLFLSPASGIIGAAHAGWRGALGGVLHNTVDAMVEMGAERASIIAVIGPCLGVNKFEVGPEFYGQFLAENPAFDRFFTPLTAGEKQRFNMVDFARFCLQEAGARHVYSSEHCTYENESVFFSYRRNHHQEIPDYGRQISVIVKN